MSSKKKSKPLFLFYLLVAYVFVQFIWWSYLMGSQSHEIYQQKTQIVTLQSKNSVITPEAQKKLHEELHKRWSMILGEGSVFLLLMILGIVKIRKSFKIEAALANLQRNFLLSVTHELKSPIASTKLQLETLYKRELNREQQQDIVISAIHDMDRLNNLVENILLATKIDVSSFPLHKEKLNLSDFLQDIIAKAAKVHTHHHLTLNIEPGILMSIDKLAFSSIILNLYENAIKYSPLDSTITIELYKKEQAVCIEVQDEGIGIPDEEKQQIFQKFYRVGNEETRKTKGTGLGLYIVNYFVKQHQGKIVLSDNSPKGSIFKLIFANE